MRRRILLAVAGVLALCGVAIAPASAATTHQAVRADIGPGQIIWGPSWPSSSCQGSAACNGINENAGGDWKLYGVSIADISIGGNGNGYQELKISGKCAGWNNTLARIVTQTCTGASWQEWAGVVNSQGYNLFWNEWEENNYPHLCPINGGYTQQVVSGSSAPVNGSELALECPLDNGFQTYDVTQMWIFSGFSGF